MGWIEDCKHPWVPVHYLHLPHTVPYSVDDTRFATLLSQNEGGEVMVEVVEGVLVRKVVLEVVVIEVVLSRASSM